MGRRLVNKWSILDEKVQKFNTREYFWHLVNYCNENPDGTVMVVLEDIDRMHSEYFLLHRFLKLHKAKVQELAPDVIQKDASNRRLVLDNGCTVRFIDFEKALATNFHQLSASCIFVIDYQNLSENAMWRIVGKTFDTPKEYSPDVFLFLRMFTDRRGNLNEVVQR